MHNNSDLRVVEVDALGVDLFDWSLLLLDILGIHKVEKGVLELFFEPATN